MELALFFVLVVFCGSCRPDARVNITVYYESLCPYSRLFLAKHIGPTYSMLQDIVNVDLVPFGLADYVKDGESWRFQCQHGSSECIANKIQSCVIYFYSSNASIPFVGCSAAATDPIQDAQQCAIGNNLDWPQIDRCANSALGNRLLYENGVKTKARKEIYGVPWITIEGVHNELYQKRARKDLLDLVCSLYNGPKHANCPATLTTGHHMSTTE